MCFDGMKDVGLEGERETGERRRGGAWVFIDDPHKDNNGEGGE